MRNFRQRIRAESRDVLAAIAEGVVFVAFLWLMALAIGVFFNV